MKKSQLKKVLAPIVEELVQETLESVLEDDDFLQQLIKESILKTGILTEITKQIAVGMGGTRVVTESRIEPQPPQKNKSYKDFLEEMQDESEKYNKNRIDSTVISRLKEATKLNIFDDVEVLEENNAPSIELAINQSQEIRSVEQAANPILAVDPQNNGGVPLTAISTLTGMDARNLGRMAGIKK